MTTPLTWQLEGQDNSLGSTFATMSAEAQRWATTVTGYANQVFTAMKEAGGVGATGGNAGTATQLAGIGAALTTIAPAAQQSAAALAQLTEAEQRVVTAGALAVQDAQAQAASLGALEPLYARLAAAKLAMERANQQTGAAGANAQVAAEERYVLALNAVNVALEKKAATAAAAAQKVEAANLKEAESYALAAAKAREATTTEVDAATLRGTAEEHAYAEQMAAQQQVERAAQRLQQAEADRAAQQLAALKAEQAATEALAEMQATQAARQAAAASPATSANAAGAGGDSGAASFRAASQSADELRARLVALREQEQDLVAIQNAYNAAVRTGGSINPIDPELPARLASVREAAYETRTALDAMGAASTVAAERTSQLGAHLQNLLFNQVFYMGLNTIQQGITDLTTHMTEGVKESETAIVTYTERLGSASAAQARWNDVSKESTQVGIPVKDLIELDTDLAKIGITSENTQARFGRSLSQIRGDLENLAALPDVGINSVEEFFTRGTEGAASLVRTLQTAGVASKEELQSVGIEFAKGSNQIVSSGDQVGRALLDLTEKKFPGLAAAQAQTMTGIETRTSNMVERVGAILGRDVFSQFEKGWNLLLDDLGSPETEATLTKVGKQLGEIATAVQTFQIILGSKLTGNDPVDMLRLYNEQVAAANAKANAATTALSDLSGAQQAAADAAAAHTQALTDLNTEATRTQLAISDLKAEEAGLTDPLQAQIASVSQYETTVLAQYQETTAGLNQSLSDVRDAATQASADAQTAAAPWQAKLADLATASQDLKAHYDSLIQPIKDQETALDRVYQRTQDIARINSAGDKVARDRALAVDIYSSEGRSAATRLPDEIAAQAQAQAEAAHNASKNVLEDRVTGLQREQAAQEANVQAQQRNDQAHITAIQNADKVTQAGYKAQEASIQTQIRETDQQSAAFKKTQDNIKEDLQLQLDNITAMYNVRLKQYDTEAALIQRNQTLLQLGNAAVMATTLATSDVVLNTIITTVNALHNTALGLIPNLQNPNAGAVPGYTGKPYQNPNAGAVPGRASGGDVAEGWYIVGENGPEPLHAGGPGQVYPNGGAGQTVTLVMEDPRGKAWFRTTWQANRSYIKQDLTSMLRGN